jgi:serine/threonine protein phosphatase 1
MSQADRFTVLRAAERIWAVGAIHGEAERLIALHDRIAEELQDGDRIVYLGNYFGYGPDAPGVLEELLRFRCWFLSFAPFRHPDDLVYLRGAQEEMWWKLLQVQFAPDPPAVLDWMAARGMAAPLAALDFDLAEGRRKAEEGTLALTYWTNRLREAARTLPGHEALLRALKRAAYTENGALLFVHTGLDTEKPLARQSDAFWWAARSFQDIDRPYRGFRRIVRGFDPHAAGIVEGEYTLSLDAGAGRGGTLAAALLSAEGETLDSVRV